MWPPTWVHGDSPLGCCWQSVRFSIYWFSWTISNFVLEMPSLMSLNLLEELPISLRVYRSHQKLLKLLSTSLCAYDLPFLLLLWMNHCRLKPMLYWWVGLHTWFNLSEDIASFFSLLHHHFPFQIEHSYSCTNAFTASYYKPSWPYFSLQLLPISLLHFMAKLERDVDLHHYWLLIVRSWSHSTQAIDLTTVLKLPLSSSSMISYS